MFTAKRSNPFAARSRARKAAQQAPAVQPKPAPEPTPAQPDPKPEAPAAVRFATDALPVEASDTPDIATVAADLRGAGALEVPETMIEELPHHEREALVEAATQAVTDPGSLDEAMPEVKRGRGRPRPQETLDRDAAVLALLIAAPEGVPKAAIAEALREKEQQIYSSLRQLSKDGLVENRHVKDVGYRWFAVGD